MHKRSGLLLVVVLAVLSACGPGAKLDGRQGAAEALYLLSVPTASDANASGSGNGLFGASWSCPSGGNTRISGASVGFGTGGLDTGFSMQLTDCGLAEADVGVAVFNGDLSFTQRVDVAGATLSVDHHFKGNVRVQGAFDDFLDADITQRIAVGDLGADGTGVSMELQGSVTTSDGTFTFDGPVTVVAGTLTARVERR